MNHCVVRSFFDGKAFYTWIMGKSNVMVDIIENDMRKSV